MKIVNFIGVFFLFTVGTLTAQTNDAEIAHSKRTIDSIISAEKALLKEKLIDIDKQVESRQITAGVAKELKLQAAETARATIQLKTKEVATKLSYTLRQKVDENHALLKGLDTINTVDYKTVMQKVDSISNEPKKEKPKKPQHSKTIQKIEIWEFDEGKYYRERTEVAGVIAFAFHNLNSDLHFGDNRYRAWGSKSFELGYQLNTRVFKNSNLLHVTYGVSWMMDKLKMKGDEYFVKEGNITKIVPYPKETVRSKFKTNYFILPINLEFDLGSSYEENEETYYPTQNNFRFGFGGYVGILFATKQKVKYYEKNSVVKDVQHRDFNVNQWTYGLSAHIGYRSAVFYARYSLVPLFTNNPVNEYPFSIGIRFEVKDID